MVQRHPAIERLISLLGRLPGVGPKSAERFTYHLLRIERDEADQLAAAITAVRESVRACSSCFQLDAQDPCSVCADPSRDRTTILVLEDPREVSRFEDAGYRGLYHVLQGRVSQVEGIGPDDLTTAALVERVRRDHPREVCLANNPDLEGEGTAQLVAERLRAVCTNVTRLARGMPAGASISQLSRSILADALDGRRPIVPPT
ncbi:MAG: recombination mediator RecR [Planctomycetota bacterium]